MTGKTSREAELAAALEAGATVLASGTARIAVTRDRTGQRVITVMMEPGPVAGRCAVVSEIATAAGTEARWRGGAFRAGASIGDVAVEVSYRPPDLLAPGPAAAQAVMAGAA